MVWFSLGSTCLRTSRGRIPSGQHRGVDDTQSCVIVGTISASGSHRRAETERVVRREGQLELSIPHRCRRLSTTSHARCTSEQPAGTLRRTDALQARRLSGLLLLRTDLNRLSLRRRVGRNGQLRWHPVLSLIVAQAQWTRVVQRLRIRQSRAERHPSQRRRARVDACIRDHRMAHAHQVHGAVVLALGTVRVPKGIVGSGRSRSVRALMIDGLLLAVMTLREVAVIRGLSDHRWRGGGSSTRTGAG